MTLEYRGAVTAVITVNGQEKPVELSFGVNEDRVLDKDEGLAALAALDGYVQGLQAVAPPGFTFEIRPDAKVSVGIVVDDTADDKPAVKFEVPNTYEGFSKQYGLRLFAKSPTQAAPTAAVSEAAAPTMSPDIEGQITLTTGHGPNNVAPEAFRLTPQPQVTAQDGTVYDVYTFKFGEETVTYRRRPVEGGGQPGPWLFQMPDKRDEQGHVITEGEWKALAEPPPEKIGEYKRIETKWNFGFDVYANKNGQGPERLYRSTDGTWFKREGSESEEIFWVRVPDDQIPKGDLANVHDKDQNGGPDGARVVTKSRRSKSHRKRTGPDFVF